MYVAQILCLNDSEMVPVAPDITDISFAFTFNMGWISFIRSLYFRIFSASFILILTIIIIIIIYRALPRWKWKLVAVVVVTVVVVVVITVVVVVVVVVIVVAAEVR